MTREGRDATVPRLGLRADLQVSWFLSYPGPSTRPSAGALKVMMLAILIGLTVICVAGIASWATVASAHALGRNPESSRQLDELSAAVAELRTELDQLANQQQADRQALEERLDFAERLLTQARDREAP